MRGMGKYFCCAFLLLTWVAQTHSFSSPVRFVFRVVACSRRATNCDFLPQALKDVVSTGILPDCGISLQFSICNPREHKLRRSALSGCIR